MLQWISAIIALEKILEHLAGAWKTIQKLWQKSPVDEQAKQNQKDDEALKNAEQKDDTSGLFGK